MKLFVLIALMLGWTVFYYTTMVVAVFSTTGPLQVALFVVLVLGLVVQAVSGALTKSLLRKHK